MNYEIPDLPSDLSATAIAAEIVEDDKNTTMILYKFCIEQIKKKIFPTKVFVSSKYSDTNVKKIIDKLNDAGYISKDETINEIDRSYQGEVTVTNRYITIENPYSPK